MALRSRIAAGQSLALILARTPARSGALGFEGVSTADSGGARPIESSAARSEPSASLPPAGKRQTRCMGLFLLWARSTRVGSQAALGFGDAFGRREDVAIAVLGEYAETRDGKVGPANHHFFGNDAINQLASRLHRQGTILVVGPLPLRMWSEQGRHVGGIVGNHQLVPTGAHVKGRMSRRVARASDETNAAGQLPLVLDQGEILPAGKHSMDALPQRLARLG